MGDQDYKQDQQKIGRTPERRMYGYTKEQWLAPARLVAKAQREWDDYFKLEDAFELVKNEDHWKGPIDAIIDVDDTEIVRQAIGFFAYGCAKFYATADPQRVRVVAPGYWGYEAGRR